MDLEVDQLDVKTAFLYGIIDQLIYVEMPKGYEVDGMVCKLLKALYGLKQSPRLWYERLSTYLLERLGLKKLNADHSIFATPQGVSGPILSVFVDDIKIIDKDKSRVARIKDELASAFKMVDLGPISYYLGIKVERNHLTRTLVISQPAYIEKMLARHSLQNAKVSSVPMTNYANMVPNTSQASAEEIQSYQSKVGSVMFPMVETRPDITFAVSVVSRYAKNPSRAHIEAIKTILSYLKGSMTRGIMYGGGTLKVVAHSDADWGADVEARRSTGAYVFTMSNGPVSWCSKRQPTVALSTTKAEYMALTQAAKEATWYRLLMMELAIINPDEPWADIHVLTDNQAAQEIQSVPENETNSKTATQTTTEDLEEYPAIELRGDNQGSIALGQNPVLHSRTKRIAIQHHYVREEVLAGRIRLVYVSTKDMIADGLTKPLSATLFQGFIRQLKMSN
jgi:hypothetical protein